MKVVKILMLIITTDIFILYKNMINILRSYLPLYSGNIEYYFLQLLPPEDPTWNHTQKSYKFDGDCLFIKGCESFKPGILDKTIKGMRLFDLNKYDFLIRTNLSSYYIFDKFLPFVSTLPRRDLYCSPALGWILTSDGRKFYGSGSIIILSVDVANYLCSPERKFLGRTTDFDDIVIGRELWYEGGYQIMDLPFQYNIFDIKDFNQIQPAIDTCPDDTIYIKVRNDKSNTQSVDYRMIFDSEILKRLVKKHYNKDVMII